MLLNSTTTPEFPDGLANSQRRTRPQPHGSPHGQRPPAARCPAMKTRMPVRQPAPTASISRAFRKRKDQTQRFLCAATDTRAAASREGWSRGNVQNGLRHGFQKHAAHAGPRGGLESAGSASGLPNHNNYIEVDKEKNRDAWGIPTLKINCSWSDNELAMSKDIAIQAAAKCSLPRAQKDISVNHEITPPGLAIHEMGTARGMGRDPQNIRLEPTQSGPHDAKKPVHDRWRLHGIFFLRESIAHVHGLDPRVACDFRGFLN